MVFYYCVDSTELLFNWKFVKFVVWLDGMKKLLLFLLVSIFSTQSIAALDVYDCEVKINQTVYEDKVYDRFYDVDNLTSDIEINYGNQLN